MNDWDDLIPKWRREGRTGPGPIAPRYASAKDRRTVRRGGTVGKDSNPGGPGGKRRRIQTNKPQGKTSHKKQGGTAKPPKSAVFIAGGLFIGLPALVVILVAYGLAHGYGLI